MSEISQEMNSPQDGSRVVTSEGTDNQAGTIAPVSLASGSEKVEDHGGDAQQESCTSSCKMTLPTPIACSTQSEYQQIDPLEEFSSEVSNRSAADLCLDAACALLQFDIAEVNDGAHCFLLDDALMRRRTSY